MSAKIDYIWYVNGKTGYKFAYDSSENLTECVVNMLGSYEFLENNALKGDEEQYTTVQNYDRLGEIYILIKQIRGC